MMDRVWGLGQKYHLESDEAKQHDLIGRSLPDYELEEALKGHEDEIETKTIQVKDTLGLSAVLVRPDGVVAWLAEESAEADTTTLQRALDRWFNF
jgi:hypothetical protein